MKWTVTVTKLGEMAQEMMEGGLLIIFNENAPEELADISVLHTISPLEGSVEKGDTLYINDQAFTVFDVGDEVNHTLKTLGHCTLKFEEANVQLPGEMTLIGGLMPQIKIGDTISIA